jgi:signal transduction histidine kinase/CheY-like chemotaxis protein
MIATIQQKRDAQLHLYRFTKIAKSLPLLVIAIAAVLGLDALATSFEFLIFNDAWNLIGPESAIGLILCASSLVLLLPVRQDLVRRNVGISFAVIASMLGGFYFIHHSVLAFLGPENLSVFGMYLPIGRTLSDQVSLTSSLNLILTSWSILSLDNESNRSFLTQSQTLALSAAIAPVATILTNLFGVGNLAAQDPLFKFGLMSGPLAFCWLALTIAVICARPNSGFARFLNEDSVSSILLRRLMIPALTIPIILAWSIFNEKHLWLGFAEFGAVVYSLSAGLLLLCAVWFIASDLKLSNLGRPVDTDRRTKSAFLANVSHELRTPLNAMMGFAELLEVDSAEHKSKKHSSLIVQNGKSLMRLIDDILDLSKFDAGGVEIQKNKIHLPHLLDEIRHILAPTTNANNNRLNFYSERSVPEWIVSDEVRLRQILLNLVGNAVKFTQNGEINLSIRASEVRYSDQDLRLEFVVQDSGVGIPEIFQAELFQPFTQLDESPTRKFGGSGLGLALAKRLARALGGDVRLVQSVAGVGTTFSADIAVNSASEAPILQSLKLQTDTHRPTHQMPRDLLDGLRILLAEDAIDSQLLLKSVLSLHGAEVEVAMNGAEALEKAQKSNFDIILMDLQMPIMDGLEATRTLRAVGCRSAIIALTAHTMKEERENSLEAGCDAHLTKPVSMHELLTALSKHRPPTKTQLMLTNS